MKQFEKGDKAYVLVGPLSVYRGTKLVFGLDDGEKFESSLPCKVGGLEFRAEAPRKPETEIARLEAELAATKAELATRPAPVTTGGAQ